MAECGATESATIKNLLALNGRRFADDRAAGALAT
jgi:hypothetical protein